MATPNSMVPNCHTKIAFINKISTRKVHHNRQAYYIRYTSIPSIIHVFLGWVGGWVWLPLYHSPTGQSLKRTPQPTLRTEVSSTSFEWTRLLESLLCIAATRDSTASLWGGFTECLVILTLFQHTELEHTPSNLYQQAISWGFLSWLVNGGLPNGCALGVWSRLIRVWSGWGVANGEIRLLDLPVWVPNGSVTGCQFTIP